MKTMKFILPLLSLVCLAACKKNKTDGDYYFGTWHVMQRQYVTPDTSYTDQLDEGNLTYTFKTNMMVDVVNLGIANISDSWEVKGASKDSIDFGTMSDWQILEKNQHDFKAKSYTDASSYFVLKLER